MTHEDFADGDTYVIKTAPTEDGFDQATPYSVPDVEDGTGTYRLPVRSGTQQCGIVQVTRGEEPEVERSEWSDAVCATGEGS